MPARRGRFGASLTPFGGGVLNLDAVYRVDEALMPSDGAPGTPPPRQYGGSPSSPWDQNLPIVGQPAVPETVAAEPLPAWQPNLATVKGVMTDEEAALARREALRRRRLRALRATS